MRALVRRQVVGATSWELATRVPAPPVARWVSAYHGYRERGAGPCLRREVSGARVVFILDLGPPILVRTPRDELRAPGFVAGLHDRYAETLHEGFQEGVQLDLSPIGARQLFGVPMHELTGRVVSLDALPFDRDVVDRVRAQPTWDARFDVLDGALARRFAELAVPGRVTAWAVAQIEQARGAVAIGALARELGYSAKHVTRLFHDYVGVGPKHYARLVRFDRLKAAADAAPGRSWADLALAFGYYDQAHMAREVRLLTGLTPSELRAERADVAFIQDLPIGGG